MTFRKDGGQDRILEAMRRRKMCGDASYFAFTATPKNAILERFGCKTAEGKIVPFHLYSRNRPSRRLHPLRAV